MMFIFDGRVFTPSIFEQVNVFKQASNRTVKTD